MLRRGGRIGLALLGLLLLASFAGPWVYPGSAYVIHADAILQSPSLTFPLGTDELGRDALARLLAGGRATLSVALPAAGLASLAGIAYGLAAGLSPPVLDRLLMRLLDALLALPSLVVLIFAASLVRLSDPTLILMLGLLAWPPLARLVRNEAAAHRNRDFILAARQLGGTTLHVGRVHLLRVLAPLLAVNTTLMVGEMIVLLSSLSFLGLGVQPPDTSWGGLIQSSLALLRLHPWWLILPPGLMVFAALLAVSLLGQSLLTGRQSRP